MISELYTPDPIETTAHLTLVHPVISTLEATMVDQENRVNVASEANSKGLKLLEQIDSTQWAQRIENAYDKPEELALIRQQYDELALQFMSGWLQWVGARRKMMDGRSIISGVIVDTLIAFQQLQHNDLQLVLKARLVAASELHGRDVAERVTTHRGFRVAAAWLAPSQTTLELVDKIQSKAFKAFAAGFTANLRDDLYTTAFAVPSNSANKVKSDVFEGRHIDVVLFVDCVNSRHKASAKLADLLRLVRTAQSNCSLSDNNFSNQQKGSVNERQHSDRLLQFLHDEPGAKTTYGKVDDFEKQIKQQEERRYEYESHRQQFALNVSYFRTVLSLIAEALKEATAETEAFLTAVEGQYRTTVDEEETLHIMINNCLAADALMRRWVKNLVSYERKIKDDISRGAGARAVRIQFENVMKRYASQVKQRQVALASNGTTGEAVKD